MGREAKTDYSILTEEQAIVVGSTGKTWYDMIIEVSKSHGVEDFLDYKRAMIFIPSASYVRKWVDDNVMYSKVFIQSETVSTSFNKASLEYYGIPLSAGQLSKMTGLAKNTIYTYWHRVKKDKKAFNAMMDRYVPASEKAKLMNNVSLGNEDLVEIIEG